MDIEIKKVKMSKAVFCRLRKVFEREWGKDKGFLQKISDGSSMLAVFGCQGYLYGGEGEDEAHERIRDAIRKEIGDCSIRSVWTYLEDLPTMEYID